MLVLTRRLGEEIVIRLEDGREITVRPVEFRGSGKRASVRLSIAAPLTVTVDRREVRDGKDAELKAASPHQEANE